jgi:4-amino-4-deoxychorismate lyase
LLAGLKHNNRLEQVLMKQALVHSDYHDALVCDADDHVIETSMANVFWHLDNIWYTPELEQCGVEGVARKALLSIMQEQGIMLREVKIPLAELTHLDEMFVCNSLQKIIPVTHVVGAQGQTRIKVSTNKRTFELQEWFNQYLANHSYTLGC